MRSEPVLARTDDSDMLKRTEVMVSEEVGNVRLEMGVLLQNSVRWASSYKDARKHTWFRPISALYLKQWQRVGRYGDGLLSLNPIR